LDLVRLVYLIEKLQLVEILEQVNLFKFLLQDDQNLLLVRL
jgi:hypothetical protein